MRTSNLLVLVLTTALALPGFSGDATAEKRTPEFSATPEAVQSRLENVRRLVTTSSGARRIESSSNAAAKAKRAAAQNHLDEAESAFKRGDMAATQNSLQRATEEMFAAVRTIGTGKAGVDKKKRDFDDKEESVNVLLNAIERVADEKGGMSAVQQRAKQIRKGALAARALEDQGKLAEARRKLDAVYEEAKLELEKLREGETLVRTLEFASDEEEYHYELDRNETHQMLLKVLTSKSTGNPGKQQLIDGYVDKSQALRQQAESEASAGAYDKAVKLLEEATKYLQRAIRSAGVFIPG
jgi:tetratricopeptide (TPR) repeat protein